MSDRKCGWGGGVWGGGVSVYTHNSLNFKTSLDLSSNCGDVESITLEIISEKTHNTIVSVL